MTITSVAELAALPATTLLESTRPNYGPSQVVVYDAGDGVLMYHAFGGDDLGWLTAAEVIAELGPLAVVHRPEHAADGRSRATDRDWRL